MNCRCSLQSSLMSMPHLYYAWMNGDLLIHVIAVSTPTVMGARLMCSE